VVNVKMPFFSKTKKFLFILKFLFQGFKPFF